MWHHARRMKTTTATVRVERKGPVTTVILARPEVRNAVDAETAAALAEAFRAFESDRDARAAVLFGEGGTFCAGADLRAIAEGRGNRVAPDGDGPMGPTRLLLTKPVVAAVEGHAVAGGLELALWCDLRVADETAVFGVFCRRPGVPLVDGGTVRLPRLVGLSRALDLILTGRPVAAGEALAIGRARRPSLSRPRSPPSRRTRSAATGSAPTSRRGSPSTRPSGTSSCGASRRSRAARCSRVRAGSPRGPAATARPSRTDLRS